MLKISWEFVNESGNLIPGPPLIFWFAFQKKPEGTETIKASMQCMLYTVHINDVHVEDQRLLLIF